MKKVILGMSGGVDSSVAAVLLKEQNYSVIGLFMKNWNEEDDSGVCLATQDFADVVAVAGQLDLPFYSVNFEKEYWDQVFSYFLEEYKAGRTPNPDVMCNQEIKFNAFLKHALELDADYIAMGHYCRVKEINQHFYLLRGKDKNKDQSYFLARITENALRKTLFPIGELEKSEVRQIAEKHQLYTAKKKDSTGICFIGERHFNQFLDQYLLTKPGSIIDVDGGLLGQHTGLIHYTIGQRKGLGIGGLKTNTAHAGEPWFVVGKDLKQNIIYVAQGEKHPALFTTEMIATKPHWITQKPNLPFQCTAKFRYRQKDIAVTVYPYKQDLLRIVYDQPVAAITPGQFAVFYQEDICLGSAIIHYGKAAQEKYEFLHSVYHDFS